MSTIEIIEPRTVRWTRDEYHRIDEAGLFHRRRVELVDGEIIEMSPQGAEHMTSIKLILALMQRILPPGVHVHSQGPLLLGEHSEPEPDVAVVAGEVRDYRRIHPRTALLVIEVSDTSFAHDRRRKAPIYARAGIPEYWIVNLPERSLVVLTDPTEETATGGGWSYRKESALRDRDSATTSVAPGKSIQVAELLP